VIPRDNARCCLRASFAMDTVAVVTATAKDTTANKTSEYRGPVLEVLHKLLAEGQNESVVALVTKLVARNRELELQLAKLQARGKKNEGVSSEQLKVLFDALQAEGEKELDEANEKLRAASSLDDKRHKDSDQEPRTEQPKRQPRLRRPIPEHLRRVDNPIPVPKEQRPCPQCGIERKCICYDVTEVIDLVPAEVIVRRDMREILGCETCDGELVRAPLGDKVVDGGRLGSTLVAVLVVDKYDDGLPLHRQKLRFERMGIGLPVSTLADQVTWGTDLLRPLWKAAIAEVIAARIMHLDGTGLAVLDRAVAGGKRLGTLWGYVGDTNIAAYLYTSTGKKEGQLPGELGPEDILKLRSGYTVADASNLFDQSFNREALVECGCNMHARRYWTKALDAGDTRAALPVAAYKKLYEIEAEIKDTAEDAKLSERQARSKPVFDEIVAWCKTHQPYEPPSSTTGAALRYVINHQFALGRFLECGAVPIDNGIVERLHVRTAIARKNFLHVGSDAGGERAAIALTILACCRLADVNPVEYLTDILPKLSGRIRIRDLCDLLPARWKAKREAAKSVTGASPTPGI
jgi:transposase